MTMTQLSYKGWREILCDYLHRFPTARQGYLGLQKRLQKKGAEVSLTALRGHHLGRYSDVKLSLAGRVVECIEEDVVRSTRVWPSD